jgi:TIR domain-containing protein
VVFISHSSHDRWIAQVIAEKIESLGAICRLDEKDLEGGDVLVAEIIQGIDACNEALVLISPPSVHSQWVAFEIGGVRAQHKRVTPILNNVHRRFSVLCVCFYR